jgi:hypothetical protein
MLATSPLPRKNRHLLSRFNWRQEFVVKVFFRIDHAVDDQGNKMLLLQRFRAQFKTPAI